MSTPTYKVSKQKGSFLDSPDPPEHSLQLAGSQLVEGTLSLPGAGLFSCIHPSRQVSQAVWRLDVKGFITPSSRTASLYRVNTWYECQSERYNKPGAVWITIAGSFGSNSPGGRVHKTTRGPSMVLTLAAVL